MFPPRLTTLQVFGMLTGPLLTSLGLARTSTALSLRPEAVKLLDEMHQDEEGPTERRSGGGGGMQGLWTSMDDKYLMPCFGRRDEGCSQFKARDRM